MAVENRSYGPFNHELSSLLLVNVLVSPKLLLHVLIAERSEIRRQRAVQPKDRLVDLAYMQALHAASAKAGAGH